MSNPAQLSLPETGVARRSIVRLARTDGERHAVFRFRYEIYVQEMRRPQMYADHARRTIEEPWDETGRLLFAEEAGRMVGTLRINFARDGGLGYYPELYRMSVVGEAFPRHVSMTTKLMVAPSRRGGPLAMNFLGAAYCIGMAHDIHYDFLDCNRHLEPFFSRVGYRLHRERAVHPEYGDVQPMCLALRDRSYLAGIRSPLLRQHHVDPSILSP